MAKKKTKSKKKLATSINKKMTFAQLLKQRPEAAKILMEKGLGCIMCPMAQQETIEQGCKVHGIKPDKVIREIEKKLEKKKKK